MTWMKRPASGSERELEQPGHGTGHRHVARQLPLPGRDERANQLSREAKWKPGPFCSRVGPPSPALAERNASLNI
uniref:Uncharacterized protein n=1 Tax=Anguilla anguilla TaxID=7936 RepID=A0A0E9R6V9_ANGAN